MRFLTALLMTIASSGSTLAAYETPITVPVHLDVTGGWGFSNAEGNTLSASTKLGQWNIGTTAAVLFGNAILIGLSSDYRSNAQTSDVTSADGNFSGKRWNLISPTLGFRTMGLVVKFDYQLLGDYELLNKTTSGASIKYTSPKGWRVSGLYQLSGLIHAGAFYENLSFSKQIHSEIGESELSPELKLGQFGAHLGLVF